MITDTHPVLNVCASAYLLMSAPLTRIDTPSAGPRHQLAQWCVHYGRRVALLYSFKADLHNTVVSQTTCEHTDVLGCYYAGLGHLLGLDTHGALRIASRSTGPQLNQSALTV